MIIGSHVVIYSRNADADRALFRDILKLTHVDVGHGWLIFGLPPSEVAVHPAEGADGHEFYLMCKDVQSFIQAMKKQGLSCSAVSEQRWGLLTQLTLPGGASLGVYQPRHARPKATAQRGRRRAPAKSPRRAPGKKASRRK